MRRILKPFFFSLILVSCGGEVSHNSSLPGMILLPPQLAALAAITEITAKADIYKASLPEELVTSFPLIPNGDGSGFSGLSSPVPAGDYILKIIFSLSESGLTLATVEKAFSKGEEELPLTLQKEDYLTSGAAIFDPDGDQCSNLEELEKGANPLVADVDQDSDGVGDVCDAEVDAASDGGDGGIEDGGIESDAGDGGVIDAGDDAGLSDPGPKVMVIEDPNDPNPAYTDVYMTWPQGNPPKQVDKYEVCFVQGDLNEQADCPIQTKLEDLNDHVQLQLASGKKYSVKVRRIYDDVTTSNWGNVVSFSVIGGIIALNLQFDGVVPTAKDLSGSNADGVLLGGASFLLSGGVSGQIDSEDNALRFYSPNKGYLKIAKSGVANFSGDFAWTIAVKGRQNPPNQFESLIIKENGMPGSYDILRTPQSEIQFVSGACLLTGGNLDVDETYHIFSVTRSGEIIKIYQDASDAPIIEGKCNEDFTNGAPILFGCAIEPCNDPQNDDLPLDTPIDKIVAHDTYISLPKFRNYVCSLQKSQGMDPSCRSKN